MRKSIFISLLFAFCAISCTVAEQEIDNSNVPTPGIQLPGFTAHINNVTKSRTSSEVKVNDNGTTTVQMYWHEDDNVAVTDCAVIGKYEQAGELEEKSVTTYFNLSEESKDVRFVEGLPLYCISPYEACDFSSTSSRPQLPNLNPETGEEWQPYTRNELCKLSVNIPTAQRYTSTAGENEGSRNLMLGKSEDGNETFRFKPIISLARFSITLNDAEEVISGVQLRTESTPIAGISEVDVETGEILSSTAKAVMLNYASPVPGPVTKGWAAVAPVDWTAAEGKVFYDVYTNKGVYTFCKKPGKAFEAGKVYNFPLKEASFTKVDTIDALEEGKYLFAEGTVQIANIRTTDSTITIAWTVTPANSSIFATPSYTYDADNFPYSTDIEKEYKIALYRDAECTDLVVSVDNITKKAFTYTSSGKDTFYPPRFTFPGLDAATTYYAKVVNKTDSTESQLLRIETAPSVASKSDVVTADIKAGDMILYENFASILYPGDVSVNSAGIRYNSFLPVTGEITLGENNYQVVSGGQEHGFFNNFKSKLAEIGFDKWGWIGGKSGATGGSVCARSGYLKIGTGSNRAFVCTPALDVIPQGQYAKVKVIFRAAPISAAKSEKYICVKTLSGVAMDESNQVSYTEEHDAEYFYLNEEDDETCWREYEVELDRVLHGSVIAIGGGLGATKTNRFQIDDVRIYVEELSADNLVYGTVKFSDETPASGVSVSDGFSVTQTDANGNYALFPHSETWYIYYSIPEDSKVNMTTDGHPSFYTKYDKGVSKYDFTLEKQAVEDNFTLFLLADPQCRNTTEIGHFSTETVPAMKAHAQSKTTPCYGVTLGDIVHTKDSQQTSQYMDDMRSEMAADKIGMPIFQTMGNHDYTDTSDSFVTNTYNDSNEAYVNSSAYTKMQRLFEDTFGPINYSWNRGNTHIVSMRNLIFDSESDHSEVSKGFSDEQYEWLKQDLALVPKDKLVILCVHDPLTNGNITANNVGNVISLLTGFEKRLVLSGHKHYQRHRIRQITAGVFLEENVVAAACGAWWASTINNDGTPNGYGVYEIVNGDSIKEEYYMSVNEGQNNKDFQMRLYRGDLKCGDRGVLGFSRNYFQLQHGSNVVLASIFNARGLQSYENGSTDTKYQALQEKITPTLWKVELYENGVKMDDSKVTFITEKTYTRANLGAPSLTNYVEVPTDSSQDWLAISYRVCVKGAEDDYTGCWHMFKCEITDPNATITVKATDPYGNVYESSEIIENGDDIYAKIKR